MSGTRAEKTRLAGVASAELRRVQKQLDSTTKLPQVEKQLDPTKSTVSDSVSDSVTGTENDTGTDNETVIKKEEEPKGSMGTPPKIDYQKVVDIFNKYYWI